MHPKVLEQSEERLLSIPKHIGLNLPLEATWIEIRPHTRISFDTQFLRMPMYVYDKQVRLCSDAVQNAQCLIGANPVLFI